MSNVAEAVRSSTIITRRNLLHIWREPGALISHLCTSIMFVVLFAFVIGGGLGAAYPEYLIPGMLGQNAVFVNIYTTVGLAYDMEKGIVDRFRSLPISRAAVLFGRTSSDLFATAMNLAILSLCGLLIGWRVRTDVFSAIGAYGLLLLFAFAISWAGAYIGLLCRRVELAQSAGIIWVFPFTFMSSALVGSQYMLQPFKFIAEWSPLTALCDTIRDLFGNPYPEDFPKGSSWAAHNSALYCTLWCLGLLAVFVPLTVRRYRKLSGS
ncbi:ABC transporter [Streptomyces cinnamoneus]|uniref:ABC transporter n=1 Tax=Streptomyces cinnamoneus TaxID=53446 RepID=A0A2G1XNC8_STRCJ|nr:ABC transporter permease [Streptomyces cinnamoneus]PHQ52659.1 ABC transporter [Streptomyces cinnamoneus]PPT12093.1 ABC transporter permease [Streptomyces cinnamoneus]